MMNRAEKDPFSRPEKGVTYKAHPRPQTVAVGNRDRYVLNSMTISVR